MSNEIAATLATPVSIGPAGNQAWSSNRQGNLFQLQSTIATQHTLYREDVRDLNALTTNKLSSYLIVTTLKIGFIVTIFWNFDRSDDFPRRSLSVYHLEVLFTVLLLTAFAFLLNALWFAMEAIVVSQTFMTDMLVNRMRIPIAEKEAAQASDFGNEEYESFSSAFRLPLLQKMKQLRARGSNFQGTTPSDAEQSTPVKTECLPHINLYRKLSVHWIYFDFYARVCISIGTSSFLAGLGYYSMYYSSYVTVVTDSQDILSSFGDYGAFVGLFSFSFLSLLSLWSVQSDVELPWCSMVLLTVLNLGGPAIVYVASFSSASLRQVSCFVPLVVCQAAWIFMLCFLALPSDPATLSQHWLAARYIDILGASRDAHEQILADWDTLSECSEGEMDSVDDDDWLLVSYGGQMSETSNKRHSHSPGSPLKARHRFCCLTFFVMCIWLALCVTYCIMPL